MHKFLTLEGILLIIGYLALAFLIVWFISLFKYKNDDETRRYFFLGFGFKMACCLGYALIYDFYYGWAGDTYIYYLSSQRLGMVLFQDPASYFRIIFDTIDSNNINTLSREETLDIIINNLGQNDFIVSTTGKTSREIFNQVRGLNSWPGAYTLVDGTILKVWKSRISDNVFSDKLDGEVTAVYPDGFGIKVSDGEIILTSVQLEGKNRMSARDFANGKDIVG